MGPFKRLLQRLPIVFFQQLSSTIISLNSSGESRSHGVIFNFFAAAELSRPLQHIDGKEFLKLHSEVEFKVACINMQADGVVGGLGPHQFACSVFCKVRCLTKSECDMSKK